MQIVRICLQEIHFLLFSCGELLSPFAKLLNNAASRGIFNGPYVMADAGWEIHVHK